MTLLHVFRPNKRYHRDSEKQQVSLTQLTQLHPLHLPEILPIVFSYLSQHTLKTTVRYVCKQWLAAARSMIHLQALWKDRTGNNYNHHFLLDRLHQVTHLQVLFEQSWMLNNTQFAWRELAETVDSLRLSGRLRITTLILNRANFLESRIYTILPKLTNLTEIRIDRLQATIHLGVVLALCPTLRELSINQLESHHEIADNTDPCWPGTLSDTAHPKESGIRTLVIRGKRVEQFSLERILSRCPRLRVLKLVGLLLPQSQVEPFDRPKFFTAVATSCPLLEYIHLSFHDVGMDSEDASALIRTFFPAIHSRKPAQSPPRQSHPTTLSLYDKDITENMYIQLFKLFSHRIYATNALTSLEILTTFSLPNSRFISHVLHDFLCTTPNLLHLVAPQIPFFAEYLDLDETEAGGDEGYYYPRLCKLGRPVADSRRLRKRMWACRGLKTLQLQFYAMESDDPSHENARIMFGYIARACPELRDLAIGRKFLNITLKGGMCLLTRLRHLERLTISTDTRVKLERKDLEWLAEHPVKRSKLAWIQKKPKMARLQKSTTTTTTATKTLSTNSSISLKDSSSGVSMGTDDNISLNSAKSSESELWTVEDMKHVGTVAELEACRQELAERGCWPNLSFLVIQFAPMITTHIVKPKDYLPAMIHEIRPGIEFSCDLNRW